MTPAQVAELLRIDVEAWMGELPVIRTHFDKFGAKLPPGLREELADLERRLQQPAKV
jgi:phosphoenolpyruvate carboxykinase (GTP)